MNSAISNIDTSLMDRVRKAAVDQKSAPHLNSGNGGGTFDGMSEKLAKLEFDVEYIKRDVHELRTDMRDVRDRAIKIETSIAGLPTKTFVFAAYGVIGALVASVTLFQTQIQQLVGIATGQ